MRTLAILISFLTLAAHGADRSAVTVHASAYGPVLFDGRGFVLYAFTRDRRGKSTCTNACAKVWPPFLVRSAARAGLGAKSSLLGTTRRSDGTVQATYAGRPLYYYVGDRKPGQILCQNVSEFGGRWLVVRADGSPVRR
jgi:predicted lipoprotein with Yx(FWY)xxD motif